MAPDPRSGIVRVLDAAGDTAGTGFVVAQEGLVATCAHVVTLAGSNSGDRVQIVHLNGGAAVWARAESQWWRGEDREDVAILRLDDGLPAGWDALPLRTASGTSGHRFRAFGFPQVKANQGLFGYGVIGDVVNGENGLSQLQLRQTTETSPGFSGAPVIDERLDRVVGMVSSITPADPYGRLTETAFATPTDVLRTICPPLQPSVVPPYRSLRAFTEDDAQFFFGRDRVVERLVGSLRQDPRFLAVLGPSGSGKSSVIQAGLVPRLRAGAVPGSQRWGIVVTRPADLQGRSDPELPGAETDLAGAVDAWLRRHPDATRCLLVLDQFEELFAVAAEQRRGTLIAQLTDLLDSGRPITVILSMRDDFYSHLAREAPLLMERWVERGLLGNVSSSLDVPELREIIERPASVTGLRFQAGLVDAIVRDAIEASPASPTSPGIRSTLLPLLEFALHALWERRDDETLLTGVYRDMGGVTGSLAQWADQAYYEFSDDLRPLVRRVFVKLVHLSPDGQEFPDSRWKRPIDALYRSDAEEAEVREVIGRLAGARLLVTGRDDSGHDEMVEIIHDALITAWSLLRDWLRTDRRFLSFSQQLEERARAWLDSDPGHPEQRDEGRLLRGGDLKVAEDALSSRTEDLTWIQREYVQVSIEVREREERERQRLLEEAVRGREEAERERRVALDRQMAATLREQAAQVLNLLRIRPVEALVLAVATMGRNSVALPGELIGDVQASLHEALRVSRQRAVMAGHTASVTAVAFAPDGQTIVSAAGDRTLRIWDADGREIGDPLLGHEDYVTTVAFSPDGEAIASGSGDQTMRLWDRWGRPLKVCQLDEAVTALAWSPDGHAIVSGSVDRTLRLWSPSGQPMGGPLTGHQDYVTAVAWSPDMTRIVSASADRTLQLWDPHGQRLGPPVAGHEDDVTAVCWSPDGTRFVSASADRTLRLWDRDGQPVGRPFVGHQRMVTAVAFDPDGEGIVSAGADRTVRFWTRRGEPADDPLIGHDDEVTALALSTDGTRVVSGSADRTLRLWDRRGHVPSQLLAGHTSDVNGIVLSADGSTIITGSADQTLRAWDWQGRPIGRPWRGHDGFVLHVAISPDGRTIASGGTDRTVRLWDVHGRPLGGPFTGHEGAVNAVTFAPDGQTVFSGSADGTLRRWRLDGEPVGEPWRGHRGEVKAIVVTPDGRCIVSSAMDWTIRRWDPDGRQVGRPFGGLEHRVGRIALQPGGLVLASGGGDWSVRLWDLEGNLLRPPLQGHQAGVDSITFSPDGSTIASGGADRMVRLWNLEGQAISQPLGGHREAVGAVRFDRTGSILLSGAEDGEVRIWRYATWGSWLAVACERLAGSPQMRSGDEVAREAAETCERSTKR